MKREKIQEIISGETDKIAFLSAAIGHDFDRETIHKFRVEVKVLRSFLRLQKMHTGDKKIKLPRKFKILYDIAGTIREAQLELELLEHTGHGLPHYIGALRQSLDRNKKIWQEYYDIGIIDALRDKLNSFKYKKLHPYVLDKFFSDRLSGIHAIAQDEDPTHTQIHDMRKGVKDVLYTSKLAQKKWKGAQKQIDAIAIDKLDKLADITGDYNDERTLLDHLRAFPSHDLAQNEQEAIDHMKQAEAHTVKQKKKKVIASAKRLDKTMKKK